MTSFISSPFLDAPVAVTTQVFEKNNTVINAVNFRDVHIYLESRQDFSDWAKRRLADFEEGIDYITHKFMVKDNTVVDRIEYIVSIDVAKNAGMLERNEKGRAFRKYFIETERSYYALLEQLSERQLQIDAEQQKLQLENEKLKEERNDLYKKLARSTHNRISTFCKNEETGKMELTSKDKKLVDIHAKYSGQYILDCCSLSQTLYSMQAFGVPFPDDFYLKDGRLFKSIYTEPCCDEKPLKSMEFAKIINNNAQDIFDFC